MNENAATDMARPVLYMDFDGVINHFVSKSMYKRVSGGLGYMRSDYAYARSGTYPINWSGELVRKLRELPAEWLWLTSWRDEAVTQLDPLLGIRSEGWLDWSYSANTGYSHEFKFDALLKDQRENPRPFVWVDDEATKYFEPELFPEDVPYLLVPTHSEYGMRNEDLFGVQRFFEKLGLLNH